MPLLPGSFGPPGRRLSSACVVIAFLCAPAVARAAADADACIAASESEIGLRKDERLRAALEKLAICAAPTCPQEVREECGRRAVALNAVLPSLVVAATDEAGNDLAAVIVTVDGAPFATALDGRPLPIDPGSHVLRLEAAGHPVVEKTIVVREGERERRIGVVLAGGISAPAPVPGAPPPRALQPPAAAVPATRAPSWTGQKSAALVSGGVGVAGVAVGSVFGLMAISDLSTQNKECPNAASCTKPAAAVDAHSSMVTAGAVSTAAFAVGAAGLVAGVVLWFTAPRGSDAAPGPAAARWLTLVPTIGARSGSMLLSGSFQ